MKIEASPLLSQSLAIDPTQLENIAGNSEAGIKQAAEQFEAIFLQLVLKSMDSTTKTMAGDNGFFNSNEQAQFRDMHNAQTAQHLASTHQLGLAEAIIKQFDEKITPLENTFKNTETLVASDQYKSAEKVEQTQSYDIYAGSAFAQPLNANTIR